MPCQYEDPYDHYRGESDELTRLTRICCDMRTILRQNKLLQELTGESMQWVVRHDKEDAARIKAEQESGERQRVKDEAMAKLSLEERRVLGL